MRYWIQSPPRGNKHLGLLLLRIGFGVMFVLHGWPKLTGGPETWERVGAATYYVGLTGGYTILGFLAAVAEVLGGLGVLLGLGFRLSCASLLATMIVATAYHWGKGDSFPALSHSIEAGIVFLALWIIGPGQHSLDYRWKPRP
jgi:putative oxidoreductase